MNAISNCKLRIIFLQWQLMISREQIVKFFTAAILTSIVFWAIACADTAQENDDVKSNISNQNAGLAHANSTIDNVADLEAIIKLPETPEEVVGREEEIANPKGKKLTAVLKYSPEAAAKIVASAEKIKSAVPVEAGVENWFPEELTAQSQLSGNESLRGISYAANDFFNPPYINGKLTRIAGTNYFVLEFTTY
ncbi:MAG: hypothetical protein ACR2LT_09895 [Pyrinomonadaceae bacterium]